VRRGLLYAGTEQAVYVSLDDGDHWQSLRLNMPATSVRDLVIKDDDLVIGTHGRGFWILDDMTPLRQLAPNGGRRAATLLRPARATRVRWNTWTDTPLPIDEPQAENPPDGAPIDYWLPDNAGRVTLEILDASGAAVRRVRSDDAPEPLVEGRNIPDWWIRPWRPLPNGGGMHRWVWDLHEATPDAPRFEYPISAVLRDTPREPRGPWAAPGRYTVRLTVADATDSTHTKVFTQPLDVRMDPRVTAGAAALAQQHTLSRRLADGMNRAAAALREVRAARATLAERRKGAATPLADSLARVDDHVGKFEGVAAGGGRRRSGAAEDTFGTVADDLLTLYGVVQGADVAPTSQTVAAADARLHALDALLADWAAERRALGSLGTTNPGGLR